MKLWTNSIIFGVVLSAGILVFAGCQKKEVVTVSDETTAVAQEAVEEPADINLDEILVVDVPEAGDAATTGAEGISGATTGSDFQFDSATTGADTEAISIEVIEDEAEANAAPASIPSAFFF